MYCPGIWLSALQIRKNPVQVTTVAGKNRYSEVTMSGDGSGVRKRCWEMVTVIRDGDDEISQRRCAMGTVADRYRDCLLTVGCGA